MENNTKTIHIHSALHDNLRTLAFGERVSLREYVERALHVAVNKQNSKDIKAIKKAAKLVN